MKRLLLIVLPLLLIAGCVRYTPFVGKDSLGQLRFDDNYVNVIRKMGPPLLNLQLQENENIVVLEYNFRYGNVLEEKGLLQLLLVQSGEVPKKDPRRGFYSTGTDHVIRLTLIDDKLVKVKIGDEIFIKE